MKKLFVLTFAILFALSATGIALADNEALVMQDGDRNEVLVDQSGEENAALVMQEGDDNSADVDQRGVSTSALVEQLGDRNRAEVEQEGATYGGQMHQALVLQGGNANEGYISQFVGYHGGLGVILQDGNSNFADIEQDGHQFGKDSFAVIAQFGSSNEARQRQTSYGSPLIRALALQIGNGNEIDQHQRHTAYADESLVIAVQKGDANYVKQYQGEIGLGSLNRYGLAVQLGNRNVAEMRQVGHEVEHVAFALQVGDANESSQTQEWGEQLGAIVQLGNRNEATQLQNSETNVGGIVQYGNANIASQTQDIGLGLGLIVQAGDRNEASQTQSAGLNLAATIQTGNGNSATVTQTGN